MENFRQRIKQANLSDKQKEIVGGIIEDLQTEYKEYGRESMDSFIKGIGEGLGIAHDIVNGKEPNEMLPE